MKRHKPDIVLIRKYLNGELSPREMYELERRAQDDPLLMDLIMGMEQGDADVHRANLSEIHQQLQQRIQRGKTKRMVAWRPWVAAASVTFALTVAGLWVFRDQPTENHIAQQVPKLQETMPSTHSERTAEAASPEQPVVPIESSEGVAPASTRLSTEKRLAALSSDTQAVQLDAVADVEDASTDDILDSIKSAELLAYQPANKLAAARAVQGKQEAAAEVRAQAAEIKRSAMKDSAMIGDSLDVHELAETVTVGYGNSKKSASTTKPAPLVGWEHYNQYLREHARSEGGRKGTVTLAFTVDGLGNPIGIRIVKGLTDTLNQRAIQLVRDGSKWQTGDDATQEVTLKIRFR